jgi:hypothetical protein
MAGIATAVLFSLLALQSAPGGQRAVSGPNSAQLPGSFTIPMQYGGFGAEGVDLTWRGTVTGPLAGQATLRMAYAGAPEDRGMPVWPVSALLFFSADDYRSSFIAELSGTMDWKGGEMVMVGAITDGTGVDTRIEQVLQLRDAKWNGNLTVRLQPRAGKAVAAVTARD